MSFKSLWPLVCGVSLFCFSSFADKNPTQPLKIGGLLHLSGEIAIQGNAFREGMELAAHLINDEKTHIPKVKLFFEDTQYKPLEALNGAKHLILQTRVDAIAISTVTEAKSAGPELQKNKVVGLVLWDSSPEIENIGNFLFGIGPWTPASGEKAANFAKENLRAKNAVIFSSNTEWSSLVAQNFKEKFESNGGKITSHIELNPQESDYRSLLQKVRSIQPDVVYGPIDSNIPTFFLQAKQILASIPIITSDVITEDYFVENKKAYEGVYQTMTARLDLSETKAMLLSYQQFFGRPCLQTGFVAWGYDAVSVLAAAHQRAHKEQIALEESLRKTKEFKGASGNISFTEKGSAPREVVVYQVKDGGFVEPVMAGAE